jgi:hypothetical protein
VLVLIAALLVIVYPRLFAPDEDEEFAPTEEPGRVLEETLAEGKSVFLEFYSET